MSAAATFRVIKIGIQCEAAAPSISAGDEIATAVEVAFPPTAAGHDKGWTAVDP
jgi:hypothetical protein